MSRRGRRIADVDSPIATVKTLFGSDGALAGGGDGDSSDDEGPFVPPVDLDALDAEIAADKLAQEAEANMVKEIQKDLRKLLDELPLDAWKFQKPKTASFKSGGSNSNF